MTNETQYTKSKFDFGTSFQYKIITNILMDTSFANSMLELLDPQYFSTNSMAWIYSQIKSYMIIYKKIPTKDALKTLIRTNTKGLSQEERLQIQKDIASIYSYTNENDLEFIQDQSIIFCKNEELAHAIYKSVDYLKNKDFDAIKNVIDNAIKKGTSSEIGNVYDSYEEIEYRYSVKRSGLVPSGWGVIDSITNGGFGAGELVVIVAPSGVGKSWFLQTIGARLIQKGRTIVHYTLELDSIYTEMRYDKIITGQPQGDFTPEQIAENLKRKIPKKTNSVVKYYPTKTATVNTIRAHLDKMIMNGRVPEAIIIDYADLLKPVFFSKDSERFNIDEIYKELRGLAGEYKCPVFTASQTNRSAINKEIISEGSIAESYGKVMIADFIMTISRTQNDTTENNRDERTSRVYIAKNRFGPDGISYNCKFDFAHGLVEMYDKNSTESKDIDSNRVTNDYNSSNKIKDGIKIIMNEQISTNSHNTNTQSQNNRIVSKRDDNDDTIDNSTTNDINYLGF